MSYPPPPGLNSNASSSSSPHALPLRPPSTGKPSGGGGFKPAFSAPASSSSNASRAGGIGAAFAAFQPRQVASSRPSNFSTYTPPAPAVSAAPAHSQYGQQQYYGGANDSSYGAAPMIQNPFPLPGTERDAYPAHDPEMEAQIAQWQSAYTGKEHRGPTIASSANASTSATAGAAYGARNDSERSGDKKQKTVVRQGGGTTWTDSSLLEWDPTHPRLFVGNLAGEVTDESLLKAFSRWPSVQKARVIRDKRTNKSKGYGFVSFSDSDDFFDAGKQMQGKYIGSHPVLVKKATTEIKAVSVKDNKHGKHHNKGKGGKSGNGSGSGGAGGGSKHSSGAGVHKPGQKTKGGLKILG